MKSDQWKADRELLRACARDENTRKGEGIDATVLYCLISHMRGKLHMKSYRKYHGGWRYGNGEYGPSWYELNSLDDQLEFLKKNESVAMWAGNPRFREAAQRIIHGYGEEALSA
jgi:hypothetical protein